MLHAIHTFKPRRDAGHNYEENMFFLDDGEKQMSTYVNARA